MRVFKEDVLLSFGVARHDFRDEGGAEAWRPGRLGAGKTGPVARRRAAEAQQPVAGPHLEEVGDLRAVQAQV